MPRIVCVIGTDGSGKTELSTRVAEVLPASFRAQRMWLGAESVLMAPVRAVLKLAWRPQRTSSLGRQFDDLETYAAEVDRKNRIASRVPCVRAAYIALAVFDYRLQLAVKLWRSRKHSLIVADRYVFDVGVNIAVALGWSPEELVAFLRHILAKVPLPVVRVYVRVEPEVSLMRKDDIQDRTYLELRLGHYDAIARAFGFAQLDGALPIEQNLAALEALILGEVAKPYVRYVHSNNTDVGGADIVLASMADHARRLAVPHRVAVSLRTATPAVDTYSTLGIPATVHPFVRPQVSGRLASVIVTAVRAPFTVAHFLRMFGREQPDIVHVNDLYDFLPAIAARLRSIPVVYHLRMIKPGLLKRTFAWLVPMVAPVSISVSDAVRRNYFPIRISNHRAEVVHDLGNASLRERTDVDFRTAAHRPSGLPEGGRLVLMVGRVEPWKGQHVFLEAIRRLPAEVRERHVFAIVGGSVPRSETYFDVIASDAKTLGIHMLGQRNDVPQLMLAADISVHCSVEPDPFPGVVVESLLAGAATIGADAGGVPELIDGPDVGILVPPEDPSALECELRTLLTAPVSPRERFGWRARRRAFDLVEPRRIDQQIADIYASLGSSDEARVVGATPNRGEHARPA